VRVIVETEEGVQLAVKDGVAVADKAFVVVAEGV
jgi:hypothetical protein